MWNISRFAQNAPRVVPRPARGSWAAALSAIFCAASLAHAAIPDSDAAQAHVVGVQLVSNALTGPLPALDGLTELRLFDIHSETIDVAPPQANHVSGSIPPLAGLRAQQCQSRWSGLLTEFRLSPSPR